MIKMYGGNVMDHFRNPRNMGEMEDVDGVGKAGNPTCGDVMKIFIKVNKNGNERILEDVKFKTFGCVAAISTSSMITVMAKDKTLKEAQEITNQDVVDELGELPDVKMHCSNLAADALHEAIYNYKNEEGLEISEKLERAHKKAVKSLEEVEDKY